MESSVSQIDINYALHTGAVSLKMITDGRLNRICLRVRTCCSGRILCITSEDAITLVPASARYGNDIYILTDVSFSVLLRSHFL